MLAGCAVTEVPPTEPTATESVEPTEEVVEVAKCYFNDYILPALPEWDQDTYPYALIYQNKDTWAFYLMCLDSPFYVTTANGVQVIAYSTDAQVKAFEYWRSDPWEWTPTEYNTSGGDNVEAIYLNPDKADFVWTNTDIYNDSGVVVYPSTEPVPIWEFDQKSFLIGFTLGISGKPLPLSKKTPIAYLYNGVQLPGLPEWDREAYPYAAIFHTPNDDTISFYNEYAYLLVSTEPLRCRTKTFAGVSSRVIRISNAHSGLCYHCGFDIEATHEVFDTFVRYPDFDIAADSGADLSSPYFPSKVIWANHDIIDNDDESVYLAASEPIPVYE